MSDDAVCNCMGCQAHQKIMAMERTSWDRLETIRRVEALCAQWEADPGDGNGLRMGQISHGAAAYWVREAISGPVDDE